MLQNETLKLKKELRLDTKESQELGTNMFELYLAVKHLHKLKGRLPEEYVWVTHNLVLQSFFV